MKRWTYFVAKPSGWEVLALDMDAPPPRIMLKHVFKTVVHKEENELPQSISNLNQIPPGTKLQIKHM